MTQRKRSEAVPALTPHARAQFEKEFGFALVEGDGSKAQMDRTLEGLVFSHHLIALLRRDPMKWLNKTGVPTGKSRKQLLALRQRLGTRLDRAERLARACHLHPERPFKTE